MTDIDDALAHELPAAADRLHIPPGDLASVLARSVRRRHGRRRVQAVSLGLVVAMLAGVTALQFHPRKDRPVAVATIATGLRQGDTGIVWRHGDTPNALAYVTSQTAGASLYALSTAPGPADPTSRTMPPRVLYRSSDGVDWAPTGRATADLYLADLSARGDRLYAVGTGTASVVTTSGRPVADLAVGWSDDAAQTWRRTKLGIDLAAIAAKATDVQVGSLSIAAGPGGVVAVAGVTAQLDLSKVLPAGIDVPNGWAMSDTGIDILGSGSACPDGTSTARPGLPPPPTTVRPVAGTVPKPGQIRNTACFKADGSLVSVTPQQSHGVERSFAWADLGIGGDVLGAVQGKPTVFWSADGEAFERIDPPVGQLNSLQVTAVGNGFAMVGQELVGGASKAGLVQSADGRQWSATAGPPGVSMATSVGQVNGQVAIVGTGERGPSSAVLSGGTWTVGSLSDLLGLAASDPRSATLAGAAVGPLGLVAVVQAHVDPPRNPSAGDYQVLFSRDGLTWSSQSLAALVDGPIARVGNVTVTDSTVIVTAIPPSPGAPADHATVVIGTI